MNIQIFGKSKCFDTKKAERWFKERRIKFQLIDIAKFGMSNKEFDSIMRNVNSLDDIIDKKSKLYEKLFIKHLASESAVIDSLFDNPALFKTPIVRNKQKATIGYKPEVWEKWLDQ
ncbi:MAG: ArsC family transcriptional regulator [Clostridiales bacterium]|nr:ArsC family transcriptional regulator [Clostridiales bacterium]